MMKKFKNKEEIFWIIFMITVLVIVEVASYLSTGHLILCGRFTGCSEI
jgi:hypothetical protein